MKSKSQTRLIILGAGRPFRGYQHSGLRGASGQHRVLDWVLQAFEPVGPEIHFIGGYQLDEICRQYPQLHYSVNPEWETTGAAASLLEAPLDNAHTYFVSYADVLFRDAAVKALAASSADITVLVDSHWRRRFGGRSPEDLASCEKVNLCQDQVTRLGRDILPELADAEFVGLARLSARVSEYLAEQAEELPAEIRKGNLSQLLELLRTRGFSVQAVDVEGDWAELNEPEDLTRFILGTKAQTLHRLQGIIKHSHIEDQVTFKVADWLADPATVTTAIQEGLTSPSLVVRSSALSEDGFASANAGAYTSVLNVPAADPASVTAAIEEVIASYPDNDPRNQVLVQPMLRDVVVSGVTFTRTLAHGGPYYVINYDDTTQSTESITSGTSRDHKTLLIYREGNIQTADLPDAVSGLLPALQEIENLLGYDSLDIEFAINRDGRVHILQVRPIAVEHDLSENGATDQLLQDAISRFRSAQIPAPFVVGHTAPFGVMPDWNPAEIIGTKPRRLAVGLYRYLIMDEVWATQRAEYGYRDVRPQPLLTVFAGHPYVDIRASFNSFVPATLDEDLAERLVDFYLDWLKQHPHLHDKVEFDVVPTCYGLDFDRWRERLMEGGFSEADVDALGQGLKAITAHAIERTAGDLQAVDQLEARFQTIHRSHSHPLHQALNLLEDCKRHGTLVFAHLARSAFVAVTLLRSAVSTGVISQAAMDAFLHSIRTVSHRLTDDAAATAAGTLAWETFVARYGHLRPGTYDITSPSYGEDPEHFLRPVVERAADVSTEHHSDRLWQEARDAFAQAAGEIGLPWDPDMLENFMRQAIEGREYAKFVFTRNLSAALDALVAYGVELGLDRDDLSHISVDTLFAVRAGQLTADNTTTWLQAQADEGRLAHRQSQPVELPPLLLQEQDFRVFQYPANQANFVGSERVIGDCVDLPTVSAEEQEALAGKIVMIPQADPGYDWLFGQGIAGLITTYGGANSHMAIRSAEFGLPAAIGIGEARYAALSQASVLELDPANRRIQVVR